MMLSAAFLTFTFFVSAAPAMSSSDFCWKDSYGRGVGTIPDQCPGRDKIGLLCYSSCPSGMVRYGFDCHSVCPEGMRDDGLFCRKAEYGRGVGYVAWDWDWCESDYGEGNCEYCLALIYPKCEENFYPFGCNICRPNAPDCGALGLGDQFDLSCAKNIIIGDPMRMSCDSSKENNAGLCYNPCDSDYHGVGPVCWLNSPSNWVNCAAGYAEDSGTCAQVILDQVVATLEVAYEITELIATGGGSAAVPNAEWESLKNSFKKAQDEYPNLSTAIESVKQVYDVNGVIETFVDFSEIEDPELTDTDKARISLQIIALFTPSGPAQAVLGAIAAYTYPLCSEIGI